MRRFFEGGRPYEVRIPFCVCDNINNASLFFGHLNYVKTYRKK